MAKENNDNTKSFFRWLDVIRAISGDKILSAPDIAKILGTSLRNAYYVVKALSAYGFSLTTTGWATTLTPLHRFSRTSTIR